ncbi:MAG: flippase-like domain-containing protein [Chloroflexi bacterium]|nr:flippase-like domain-containing protein [Chloroflexota bacterium]
MLKRKRFWLGLAISVVLLAVVFYQTDPAKIAHALQQAQYGYLIPALALYFLGVGIRAVRWHYLLRSIKPIPSGALFRTVVIGYMANDILPARMGELVRAYILGAQENVSKTATLVTILVERIFDGLTMIVFIIGASLLLDVADAEMNARLQLVGALFIGVVIVLAIIAGMPNQVERIADFFVRRLPDRLRERARGLARALLDGLGALRSPRDSLTIFALSLGAWVCETTMYIVIALGFNIALPFAVFLFATAFANLVTIAPSTPGYVGVFDWPIVYTLTRFGIDQNLATSYTLVLHAALVVPVTLLGFYYAWRAGLSLTQMTRAETNV